MSIQSNCLALDSGINSLDPAEAVHRVDDLSHKIILKELELERFNLYYKKEVGKQGRWRGWRYAAFQEANFGLNMTNGIISTAERSSHFTHPARISPNRIGKANIDGMIGSIIGASASALELGVTEYHDHSLVKQGFSPSQACKHVLTLKDEINQLMTERDALIAIERSAPFLNIDTQLDKLEGNVLRDIRDMILVEFEKFHIRGRRSVAFQRSQYFLDMSKFTCSAIGSFFAYMTLHKHDRKWNARAGVLFETSGALIMTAPIVSRLIGSAAEKYHDHLVAPIVKDAINKDIATLQADEASLEKFCNETKFDNIDRVSKPLQRAIIYKFQNKGFQDQLYQSSQEQRAGKLVATQTIASGLFVGGTKVTNGVLYNVVGVISNGKRDRDGRITNYNLATAAMLTTIGSGFALLDTLRLQVKAEITRHKDLEAGTLPGQLIDARLAELDNIEKKLNSFAY